MHSPRTRSPRRGRKLAFWAAVTAGAVLPTVGCQVEYAGMTLPSGKYMHDDVQYFPPGPNFPWANTQAATQRARMQAMGLDVSGFPTGTPGPGAVPPAAGAIDPGNINQAGSMRPNVNVELNPPGGIVPPPDDGAIPGAPLPGGNVPVPPAPNGGMDSLPR